MITGLQPAELPHSEISGSKVVCTYPKLIAAYHVLRRLLEPRHPPFALFFFFYNVKLYNSDLKVEIGKIYYCELIVFCSFNPTIYYRKLSRSLLHCQYVKDLFPQFNEDQEVSNCSRLLTYIENNRVVRGEKKFLVSLPSRLFLAICF